jgi:uncharacterized protein with PIN domain
MRYDVICTICNKELVELDKEEVTQEDIDLYKATVACEDHGSEGIDVQPCAE